VIEREREKEMENDQKSNKVAFRKDRKKEYAPHSSCHSNDLRFFTSFSDPHIDSLPQQIFYLVSYSSSVITALTAMTPFHVFGFYSVLTIIIMIIIIVSIIISKSVLATQQTAFHFEVTVTTREGQFKARTNNENCPLAMNFVIGSYYLYICIF
jgi:hypothetical protein